MRSLLTPRLLFIAILFVLALPLLAQDGDAPLTEPINYDQPVDETLTEQAFWDWWQIEAASGDVISAEMQASETLAPLLGILGPDGSLLARSDEGSLGGTVTLDYHVEDAGQYTLVATRVGNENGTTTGSYQLLVRQAAPPRLNPYQEVSFRCHDYEVTNVATLEIEEDDVPGGQVVIAIYGLDGFQPVIRAKFEDFNLDDCSSDASAMGNDSYQLPGEAPVTLTPPIEGGAAELVLSSISQLGRFTLTVGSMNGAAGRYIAVIYGLTIGQADRDQISLGQGPLASSVPLNVYMIGAQGTRLDPKLNLLDQDERVKVCDDVGQRGCEGVPSPLGLRVFLAGPGLDIEADRFDAGISLPPGPPRLWNLELSSYSDRTTGPYSIVLLGSLPAHEP